MCHSDRNRQCYNRIDSRNAANLDSPSTAPRTLLNHTGSLQVLLWERKQEHLPSFSKIQVGHWKAWQLSPELTKVACSQFNLIACTNIPPSHWRNGLQVLLEKVPGVALVDKLRAILLMEGDFTFFNKWIFGHVAVNKLQKIGYIPEDK